MIFFSGDILCGFCANAFEVCFEDFDLFEDGGPPNKNPFFIPPKPAACWGFDVTLLTLLLGTDGLSSVGLCDDNSIYTEILKKTLLSLSNTVTKAEKVYIITSNKHNTELKIKPRVKKWQTQKEKDYVTNTTLAGYTLDKKDAGINIDNVKWQLLKKCHRYEPGGRMCDV